MGREHSPSIIFMDEVDSIGSARSDSGGGGGGDSEVQRTMLELLNQLDGFEATNKIKVSTDLGRLYRGYGVASQGHGTETCCFQALSAELSDVAWCGRAGVAPPAGLLWGRHQGQPELKSRLMSQGVWGQAPGMQALIAPALSAQWGWACCSASITTVQEPLNQLDRIEAAKTLNLSLVSGSVSACHDGSAYPCSCCWFWQA